MGAWKIPAAVDTPLYDLDFWLWSQEQAERLRELRPAGVDWEHLAEEIESLGKRDRRELFSRIEVLVMHLLA